MDGTPLSDPPSPSFSGSEAESGEFEVRRRQKRPPGERIRATTACVGTGALQRGQTTVDGRRTARDTGSLLQAPLKVRRRRAQLAAMFPLRQGGRPRPFPSLGFV